MVMLWSRSSAMGCSCLLRYVVTFDQSRGERPFYNQQHCSVDIQSTIIPCPTPVSYLKRIDTHIHSQSSIPTTPIYLSVRCVDADSLFMFKHRSNHCSIMRCYQVLSDKVFLDDRLLCLVTVFIQCVAILLVKLGSSMGDLQMALCYLHSALWGLVRSSAPNRE